MKTEFAANHWDVFGTQIVPKVANTQIESGRLESFSSKELNAKFNKKATEKWGCERDSKSRSFESTGSIPVAGISLKNKELEKTTEAVVFFIGTQLGRKSCRGKTLVFANRVLMWDFWGWK